MIFIYLNLNSSCECDQGSVGHDQVRAGPDPHGDHLGGLPAPVGLAALQGAGLLSLD